MITLKQRQNCSNALYLAVAAKSLTYYACLYPSAAAKSLTDDEVELPGADATEAARPWPPSRLGARESNGSGAVAEAAALRAL